ncbi:hypothetical protein POM88_047282 [Heracleum sosnowskyi]|uniref:Uncharacterized protein n=1 Tax=Heracleum sosnowskyi TaxID=360622 RepID=A0AAD8GU03_9APIA|nr:hypothetical protein POM88_047282 [Heracleum sosnowskyi]
MANIVRRKKVTDPLDEKVKARIIGSDRFCNPFFVSSGSEHSSQHGDIEEDGAPCLSNLLCGFLDQHDDKEDQFSTDSDSDSDQENDCEMHKENFEILNKVIFNEGICKTKWERSGGLTSGSYEFIDVLRSDDPKSCRYFIDLNFVSDFEIARRTSQYERILRALPNIFVGKSENLKQIVRIMSDGARRSLKSQDLHVPPWRKNRFMQSKWFGKYKRTVNIVPASSYSPVKESAVKCRSVGFVPFMAATTRTR